MKPSVTTNEIVQFMQHLRSTITDGSLKMSDLKLELVDIEVDTMTETFYYKIERYVPEAFIGAEYGNAVEIWRYKKTIDIDDNGGQVFDLDLVEQTFM